MTEFGVVGGGGAFVELGWRHRTQEYSKNLAVPKSPWTHPYKRQM